MTDLKRIERALISVSDKTGLLEFAKSLIEHGVTIISTGGTARSLRESGIPVTEVSEVTGFPEMMDGRVKTLHPKIHGGFLALRDDAGHIASMREHGIEPIDLVVVNLYPFEETVADPDVALETAIENIDIGGPAMIRSASKNYRDVAVVTDSGLYPSILAELNDNSGSLSLATRRRLATLAYTRTAAYDLAISTYLAGQLSDDDITFLEPFNPLGDLMFIEPEDRDASDSNADADALPETVAIELTKVADLRYGENPHQRAALYTQFGDGLSSKQLQGKEMSFNNYVDAGAAWELVGDFDELAVAIIKHTNPSGVSVGASGEDAYAKALSTDPVSAFGGIVAFNRAVDAAAAAAVIKVFTEVVVAPAFDDEALQIFGEKKNLRVLQIDPVAKPSEYDFKQLPNGFLLQEKDRLRITESDLTIVSEKQPTEDDIRSMLLAWRVCKHVKSNAIVIANSEKTLGVGSGQMNRVDSVRIAAMRAERFELPVKGSALASDAFFPFRDNVDEAATIGVGSIIQPGGSVKDQDSITAANEHGLVMAFTGRRHFKH